jgi:acyl-CoA synthetase (AMP-forming)/AMP-acid ligase II
MHDTLIGRLDARATAQPDATALLAPGRRPLGYAALRATVERSARALRAAGLGPRSRIATSVPNGPEAAATAFAIAAAATCVPLNPALRVDEARFELEDARCDAVLLPRGDGAAVREAAAALGLPVLEFALAPGAAAGDFEILAAGPSADTTPDWPGAGDVALILHTSGTTARPKTVPLTQANLSASAASIAAHLALAPADVGLGVMPLFHIHGLVGSLFASLSAGAALVCTPGFDDAAFFEWVAEFRPTWYTAVPTIHQAVLARGDRYRRLAPDHHFRFVRSSSASLPPQVLQALEALTGAPVVEAYGMTEASHQMTSNPLPPGARKAGTVGVPAGARVAIMDAHGALLPAGATGEVAIRGAGVTAGYERNPEANATAFVDGWFRTGDQGRLDADGYLTITGRLKEIVNRGGEKVSPREVDEALLDHPGVAQAAAFAVPHPALGEDLAAAVVARAGAVLEEAALRAHLFARVAPHKVPSRILVVDAIPKGATGKVQRTRLHEALAARLEQAWVAPRDGLEAAIAECFAQVLGRGPIGARDNFFALGGDSLSGARAVARLNASLDAGLRVEALFRHPSPEQLAAAIDDVRREADDDDALAAEIDALSDEEVERLLARAEAEGRAA